MDHTEIDVKKKMFDSLQLLSHGTAARGSKQPKAEVLAAMQAAHTAAVTADPTFYAQIATWYWNNRSKPWHHRDAMVLFASNLLCSTHPNKDILEIHRQAGAFFVWKMNVKMAARVSEYANMTLKERPRRLRTVFRRYVNRLENDDAAFDSAVMGARRDLRKIYVTNQLKPSQRAGALVFKREKVKGSAAEVIARLGDMTPDEQIAAIKQHKIPFRVAVGAIDSATAEVAAAIIETMSAYELSINMSLLERWGALESPVTSGYIANKLATLPNQGNVDAVRLMTAAQKTGNTVIAQAAQTRMNQAGRFTGTTVILADMSQSMEKAIEAAIEVAAYVAGQSDKVFLIFSNTAPMPIQVNPGDSAAAIKARCRHIVASGWTSLGVGLAYMRVHHNSVDINNIICVTDQQENSSPYWASELVLQMSKPVKPKVKLINVNKLANAIDLGCKVAQAEMTEVTYTGDPKTIPALLGELSVDSALERVMEIASVRIPQWTPSIKEA